MRCHINKRSSGLELPEVIPRSRLKPGVFSYRVSRSFGSSVSPWKVGGLVMHHIESMRPILPQFQCIVQRRWKNWERQQCMCIPSWCHVVTDSSVDLLM